MWVTPVSSVRSVDEADPDSLCLELPRLCSFQGAMGRQSQAGFSEYLVETAEASWCPPDDCRGWRCADCGSWSHWCQEADFMGSPAPCSAVWLLCVAWELGVVSRVGELGEDW